MANPEIESEDKNEELGFSLSPERPSAPLGMATLCGQPLLRDPLPIERLPSGAGAAVVGLVVSLRHPNTPSCSLL